MRMSRHIRTNGGVVICQRQLEGSNSQFMLHNGVHLNDISLNIFLSGVQDAIERDLFILLSGGRSLVYGYTTLFWRLEGRCSEKGSKKSHQDKPRGRWPRHAW